MTLHEKLRRLASLLAKAVPNVYHYFRANKIYPCAIWQESGTDILSADNGGAEINWSGTLDVFTKEEFDPAVERIYAAMGQACISFSVVSVQFEEETNLIHYEFEWVI